MDQDDILKEIIKKLEALEIAISRNTFFISEIRQEIIK